MSTSVWFEIGHVVQGSPAPLPREREAVGAEAAELLVFVEALLPVDVVAWARAREAKQEAQEVALEGQQEAEGEAVPLRLAQAHRQARQAALGKTEGLAEAASVASLDSGPQRKGFHRRA